jgi:hypothetical protein
VRGEVIVPIDNLLPESLDSRHSTVESYDCPINISKPI